MQAQERTFLKILAGLGEVDIQALLASARVHWRSKAVKGRDRPAQPQKTPKPKDNRNYESSH